MLCNASTKSRRQEGLSTSTAKNPPVSKPRNQAKPLTSRSKGREIRQSLVCQKRSSRRKSKGHVCIQLESEILQPWCSHGENWITGICICIYIERERGKKKCTYIGDSMLCYDSFKKLQGYRIGSEFGSLSDLINIAVL